MIRILKGPCFCPENQLCKQFCWVKDLRYKELLNCRSLLCLLKIENNEIVTLNNEIDVFLIHEI